MTKYSALSQHLSALSANSASLTFSEIEEIIGDKLPSSAFKHHAWWANESDGTHTWAHLWQAAGWLRDSVDFEQRIVTFRRANETEIDILETLKNRQISIRAFKAFDSMNALLGSTNSPINVVNISSAAIASSICTRNRRRTLGSIVVSHSCSGFISPRPL